MKNRKTFAQPTGRQGKKTYGKFNQKPKFDRTKKSGGFRGKGGSKHKKLDIASFINKTVAPSVPEEVFIPKNSFKDFELNFGLLKSIEKSGYKKPTPIQDEIIPFILQGEDVVGLANTGTGKTAAFLIPLVEKILKDSSEQILIITPTRELATQIDQELRKVVEQMRIFSVICVGGEYIGAQIRKLRHKNQFIIGTPGRLIDLVNRRSLKLKRVHTFVLDEADRMLDMGFIDDIKLLMSHAPIERQTLCFSATMSKKIEGLTKDFLRNPKRVSVKTTEMPTNIEQDVVKISNSNRVDVLHGLLKNSEFKKVLVFGRTKRGVENLSKTLIKRGMKVDSIHGDKSQGQRKKALSNFKTSRVQTLVATDVAARGIHVDDITHVINYEVPESYDDYIHRIGRTGRGTQRGKALTFID